MNPSICLCLLRRWPLVLTSLFGLLIIACGTAATDTPATTPAATSDGAASTAMAQPTLGAGPNPTAMPQPTAMPSQPMTRAGTLNIGEKETGVFEAHPQLTSSPRIQFTNMTVGEGLVRIDKDLSPKPLLAESWSISPDFLTWTFHIRKGVQFHKGYGEMTAEDVVYSYDQFGDGSLHARGSFIKEFFRSPQGSLEIPDSYTIVVNTGVPQVDNRVFEFMRTLGGSSTWVVSRKQSGEMGVEAAGKDIAATGPWEIVEHKSGEFWKFQAVENHWRQTPYFAELVLWSIPEESSRLAGFQTGNLDNFDMAFDTIPEVQKVDGAQLVSFPNSGQMGLNLYGQLYTGLGLLQSRSVIARVGKCQKSARGFVNLH